MQKRGVQISESGHSQRPLPTLAILYALQHNQPGRPGYITREVSGALAPAARPPRSTNIRRDGVCERYVCVLSAAAAAEKKKEKRNLVGRAHTHKSHHRVTNVGAR